MVIGEKIREDVVVDLFNKPVTDGIGQAGKRSPSPLPGTGGGLSDAGSSRFAGITERLPWSV